MSGLRTTHVLPPSQRGVVWSLDDTFLDVGASSREEVERMGIRPGDGIAPKSDFLVMPNGRYAGKAWDDRVGLGVMIAAARRIRAERLPMPAQIVWVATTQEEIGLRGAQTAVEKARPDLGISIEAGVSADYPAIGPTQAQERLGGGPGIFLLDSSMIPNRKLRDFFFDVAQQAKIPLQPNVLTGYGEDGAEIQRYDSGRPTVNMTVPTRYLHGHTGVIQRSDFDGAVALLLQVLTRLDAQDRGATVEFRAVNSLGLTIDVATSIVVVMATPLHVELKQARPFDLLEEEVHVSIARTAAVLERAVAQTLKPHGLTPTQYNVLRILRGAGAEGLCRNEVGARLIAPVPDVTRLLDRMAELQLIGRASAPTPTAGSCAPT